VSATVTALLGTATSSVETRTAGALETGPSSIAANWLANVERRLRDSIAPPGNTAPQLVQWLSADVANSAIQFFRMASDFLPGEPYIYSSNGSDLIAEFTAKHGTLTSVVSATGLSILATVDGVLQKERVIDLRTASAKTFQSELKPITLQLTRGTHGPTLGA